ncbi:MAG: GDSL-type esterase/lipase family protein [Methylacidiphilales bacterium]|nr:GDSL-type esterase/lipase family protein [Candidatus Methylacidiphilales bacterium]
MKTNPTKLITLILVTLTTIVALADTPPPIDPSSYTAPIRVACVGDSITVVNSNTKQSWPDQLQAILGDKWVVKNFGVSGRTLLKKGDCPYWKVPAFKDAHSFNPDVVIIMLGTNDTKPQNWVRFEDFSHDYRDLVDSFKKLSSSTHIFICHPPPVFGGGKYGINEANVLKELEVIDRVAADEGVNVIDIHGAMANNPELFGDGVHPIPAGSGVMAKTIAAALTPQSAPAN